MKRVLVTGATGFVGRSTIKALLAANYEVHAVGRTKPSCEDVTFERADLLDATSRRHAVERARASHLLHLAWISDPGLYWRSPLNMDWAAASLDILKSFREAGGARAVITGSCAEYAWSEDRLREGITPCRPATFYGTAKDATRRIAMHYASEWDLSAAWARLFFLYGPGEKSGRLVSDAVAALRAKRPFPTTSGLQKRDFLHVGDAAAALVALLDSRVTGAVNVGSGEAVAVREILDRLADLIGNRDCLLFGRLASGAGDPAVIEADIARLASEVGFRRSFDLASGLADTVARTA